MPDYYLFVAGFFPLSQGIIPSRDKSKWNTFSAYLHHFSEVDISCSGAVGATEDALIRFNVKVCRQIRHGISLWNINRYLANNTASPRQYGILLAAGGVNGLVEEIFVRVCFEAVLSIGRLYGSGIVYLIV